ncbi:unnamed protein product, partial [Prorocentrum cordatum]
MRQEEFNWFVFQAIVAFGLLILARSYWQQFRRAWHKHGSADGSKYLLELAGVVGGPGHHGGLCGPEDFSSGAGKAERRRKGGGHKPGVAVAEGRGRGGRLRAPR